MFINKRSRESEEMKSSFTTEKQSSVLKIDVWISNDFTVEISL